LNEWLEVIRLLTKFIAKGAPSMMARKLLAKKLDYMYKHAPNIRKPKNNLEMVEGTIY
jgi:hypothetical protein